MYHKSNDDNIYIRYIKFTLDIIKKVTSNLIVLYFRVVVF